MNQLARVQQRDGALITAEHAGELLRYCPQTGNFTWSQDRGGGARVGDIAGTATSTGYRQIRLAGRLYFAHRLAWLLTHGAWPSGVIDHIDGNGMNNRIENLRDVSVAMNQQNQRRAHRSNKSSGLLGAHFDQRTGRWLAKISVANKTINIGRFATAQLAHKAYIEAKGAVHNGAVK